MKVQLSKTAQSDIQSVLRYSLENFGHTTMKKYQSLIAQAIDDIAEAPNRLGVKSVSGHNDYYQYHLRMSRRNVSGQQIAIIPRIVLFFVGKTTLWQLSVYYTKECLSNVI